MWLSLWLECTLQQEANIKIWGSHRLMLQKWMSCVPMNVKKGEMTIKSKIYTFCDMMVCRWWVVPSIWNNHSAFPCRLKWFRPCRFRHYVPFKCQELIVQRHCIKTWIFCKTTVRTSNLATQRKLQFENKDACVESLEGTQINCHNVFANSKLVQTMKWACVINRYMTFT